METLSTDLTTERIETTLGDLISAISEAAREAHVDENDLSTLTQLILADLLQKRKH